MSGAVVHICSIFNPVSQNDFKINQHTGACAYSHQICSIYVYLYGQDTKSKFLNGCYI